MDDDASRRAVEDFDRRVLGESAGASVRQVEPPDVPTSSAEGVPEGYVEPESTPEAGNPPEAAAVGETGVREGLAVVPGGLGYGEPPGTIASVVKVSEPGTDLYEQLDRAAALVEAAERVSSAAEVYAEAMKNAFLRLPNRARPYAEHAELLGALVAWHRARAGD